MDSYYDNLRKIKSLLIVTSLQRKEDLKAYKTIENLKMDLDWSDISGYMIDDEVWEYVVQEKKYDPKFVFCHPEVIKEKPNTSLYYRCLTGLSIKAAKGYIGSIENIEKGKLRSKLDNDKALKMIRVYNTFICSIIKGSSGWTLENGKRTIVATLGITIDGIMRNKVGVIAEERVRNLISEYLIEKDLIISPTQAELSKAQEFPVKCVLKNNVIMRYSSEPDISFSIKINNEEGFLAIIEIKGGIDPAGALERYGAATKSFQHALQNSRRCKNFFLSAVYTPELQNRIKNDRLVEKYYDIIEILEKPAIRNKFFKELFHYTLRIM